MCTVDEDNLPTTTEVILRVAQMDGTVRIASWCGVPIARNGDVRDGAP